MKHGPDHEFSTMEGRVVNAFDSSFQKGRSETGKYPPENLFHRRVFHLDPAIVNRGIVKIPIVNFLFQFTAEFGKLKGTDHGAGRFETMGGFLNAYPVTLDNQIVQGLQEIGCLAQE
jgi:hypothetical protein